MLLKKGVILSGLDIRMRPALISMDALYGEFGHELVVTSGLDGEHSAGSLHYYGLAFDCRTRYFTDEQKENIQAEAKKRLGNEFVVLLEPDHLHIQYSGLDRWLSVHKVMLMVNRVLTRGIVNN